RANLLRHVSENTKNVSKTCRHFGISRKTFYKWIKRYELHGDAGLCNQSRKPHLSPRATPKDVVSKILYLRQNYHFGPSKVSDYLQRYHKIKIAQSTVHRILRQHNLNRLPANNKEV